MSEGGEPTGVTLDEMLDRLPEERRRKVDAWAAALLLTVEYDRRVFEPRSCATGYPALCKASHASTF